jgi:hypothetical protein
MRCEINCEINFWIKPRQSAANSSIKITKKWSFVFSFIAVNFSAVSEFNHLNLQSARDLFYTRISLLEAYETFDSHLPPPPKNKAVFYINTSLLLLKIKSGL